MHFTLKQPRVPHLDPRFWSFTIRLKDGLTRSPLSVGYDDLLALPAHEIETVIPCPPRAEGDRPRWHTARFRGAALRDLLDTFDPNITYPSAECHTGDGYVRSFPTDLLYNAYLAYEQNGEPLTPAQGAPVRLVLPRYSGDVMLKWLTRLDLQHGTAPDIVPETFVTLDQVQQANGIVTLRGLAYGGDRVDVQLNHSQNHMGAELEPHGLLMRWQLQWTPPAPGAYRLQVRLMDTDAASTNTTVEQTVVVRA